MAQESTGSGLAFLFIKFAFINAGSYLVANYDKVLGAILTTISILYVSFKLSNEYLIPLWRKYIKK